MGREARHTLHLVEFLDQGGIERLLENLARYTPRERIGLSFFSYESETLGRMGQEIAALGIPVLHSKKAPGYDLRLLGRLIQVIRELKVTVVHTHDFGPMEYAVALKLRFPRLKLVHTHHTLHHFIPQRRYRFFFQAASLFYDSILCVSGHVQAELSHHCPAARWKLRTVCNGVDVDALKPPSRHASPSRRLRLVNVSRISPEKNLLHTLEACRVLKERGIAFSFHHAGSGAPPEEARARAFVARHGLVRNVHFHGFLTDVRPVLAEGDVFVSSSRTEGHPVAVLEAMASGKICVLSDIAPHRELAPKASLFFELEGNALADLLARLATELPEYHTYAKRARAEVVSRFSIQRMVEAYCQVYERA